MSDLPPEALALLERARREHDPTHADRERVRASLHASLAIAPMIPAAPAAAKAAASVAPASVKGSAAAVGGSLKGAAVGGSLKGAGALVTWKAGKLLLASLALGGAVGGLSVLPSVQTGRDGPTQDRAAIHAPMHATADREAADPREHDDGDLDEGARTAPVPRRARGADASARVRSPSRHHGRARRASVPSSPSELPAHELAARQIVDEAEDTARPGDEEAPAQRSHEEPAPRAREPEPAEPEPPAPSFAQHEQELRLIRRALTSLRDGDASEALALLKEHASRYPQGAFVTERRGLRVIALCSAGLRDEGLRERSSFLKHSGSSPIAERVRHACGEGKR